MDWVGRRDVQGDQGVAALVVGGQALFVLGHRHGLALGAHHDAVLGVFEVALGDHAAVLARSHQGGFVDQVGEVGAGEAGGAARDGLHVDVGGQRHVLHVDAQDAFTTADVGIGHHDLTVEAARTQQGRVKHVGTVGRGDHDDRFRRVKAVHLDQQLVEGLFAFVVTTAQASATMAADGVDFVDEDDAGAVFLSLLEHVADAAGADADEHFNEVGARNVEERHTRLARDGAAEQGLTRTGRTDHQGALRDLAAQALEFRRVLQEVDDLRQLFLRLVHAGDVIEGHAVLVLGHHLGLGLAKAHGPAGAALHLTHEEDPDADQQQDRQAVQEQAQQAAAGGLHVDVRALRFQALDQVFLIAGRHGRERLARVVLDLDGGAAKCRSLDLAGVHPLQQLGIGDLAGRASRLTAAGHHAVQPDEHDNNDAPNGEITQVHDAPS